MSNFLGIFFNVDELGAAYGLAAYRLLFETARRQDFYACSFSDGDIGERYCIGIEGSDSEKLFRIEAALGKSDAKGLSPANTRFAFDPRITGHLLPAGYLNYQGDLERIENTWLRNAWNETAESNGPDEPEEFETLASTLLNTSDLSQAHDDRDEYQPGELIGQDYLVRDVRKGGMGIVYVVEDLLSRSQGIHLRLALKTFQSKYLSNNEAISRFEREALLWVRLGKHPNIVHAMLVHRVADRPYLWLEFVDGESLADRIERTRLRIEEVISFAVQFCNGMRHAYEEHGLIHRDIKPANILVGHDDVLKITDFGLSKLQAEFLGELCKHNNQELNPDEAETVSGLFITTAGRCVGTPAYIAPEALRPPYTVDIRGDIYSFGIVLYEMLTGQRPFKGSNIFEQHISIVPLRVRELEPNTPNDVDDLVARCLEKDPDKRFQTFAELQLALVEAHGKPELPSETPTIDIPVSAQRFMQGFTFMELAKYEQAITCFEGVIELDPQQAEAYNNVGVCHARLGRMDDAVRFVQNALHLNSVYAEAWSNLGGFYEQLGRFDEGIEACERAIELKPRWAEAHANLGKILMQLGRIDEARACFERAIAENKSYRPAYALRESIARMT